MPVLNYKDFKDGNLYFIDDKRKSSKHEQAFWYFVVVMDEPEHQNWRQMVTVRNNEEVFACLN